METTGGQTSSIFLLFLIQGLLGSGAVEVQPSVNPARVGDTVTLEVSPPTAMSSGSWSAGDSLVLTWQGEQHAVFPGHAGRASVNTTTGTLTLTSVSVADSGLYVVRSADPPLQANATITVLEPVSNVTLRSNATNVVEFHDSAVFTCSVSTGSSLSYLWMNGSSEVTAGDGIKFRDGGSTLTIVNVTRYDQGPFMCNVSNAVSSGISQSVMLSIYYGPDNLELTGNGQNSTSFISGTNLTLLCSAQSNPPALLQWSYPGNIQNTTGPELKLYGVSQNHSGLYSCLAFNNKTYMYSNITKYITIAKYPPSGSERLGITVWLLPFLSISAFVRILLDL